MFEELGGERVMEALFLHPTLLFPITHNFGRGYEKTMHERLSDIGRVLFKRLFFHESDQMI